MRFPARKISTDKIVVSVGGKNWNVEIFEADFHYPLLARWTEVGATVTNEDEEIWTVANHFFVSAGDQGLLDEARRAVEKAGRADVQIRSSPASSSFRVEPAPAIREFRQISTSGKMLTLLADLHKALGPNNVIAEPDYVIEVNPFPGQPADQDFDSQEETLQLIRAQEAWKIHEGGEAVTVAVIDTGVDYQHPDLDDNIFRQDGQLVGTDLYDGALDPDDRHWHGTYGAGLVGAEGDNGIGITGICPKCKLMPIRAFSDRGVGTSSLAAKAIRFAVEKSADVILCAWGSPIREEFGTSDVEKAIRHAREKGVMVVASAGNHEGTTPHYPASFDIDNVISVGGTDANGQPVPAWGHVRKVHISAPGTAVYSTIPTRIDELVPYMVNSGTSPAAALVAGACALLKSYAIANGLSTDYQTIRTALIDSATPFEAGDPGRRLNVEAALNKLKELSDALQPDADLQPPYPRSTRRETAPPPVH